MASLKRTNSYFRISCAIGFLLSCYAFYVEVKKEDDEDYEAYCDINEHISCTKAFSSPFGKGFGIIGSLFGKDSKLNQPNSIAGIIFYVLLLLMNLSNKKNMVMFQTVLCLISNFMSVYLAYILYYILHDFCIVCVGTYIINAINLALSLSKWNLIAKNADAEKHSRKRFNYKKE